MFATLIVFKANFTDVQVGLLIKNSTQIENWFFRFINNFTIMEYKLISMERCFSFSMVEPEKENGLVPLNWPSGGKIQFENYSSSYSAGQDVIKKISLTIERAEKVAIVGRTGCGKSSLCLGLMRILEATSGNIKIDGLNIAEINLRLLRSEVTNIPQNPMLMKDTLRYNIDPLNAHTDEEIWEVARKTHLADWLRDGNLNIQVEL